MVSKIPAVTRTCQVGDRGDMCGTLRFFFMRKWEQLSRSSANRGNHNLRNRGHKGFKGKKKLTLAKYIDARVAAGCTRSTNEHMLQRRWQKKRG